MTSANYYNLIFKTIFFHNSFYNIFKNVSRETLLSYTKTLKKAV